MKIYMFHPMGYLSNTYLAIDEETNKAAVFDPSGAIHKVVAKLEEKNAQLEYIFLTHGHFDHIFALDEFKKYFQAPVAIHEADNEMLLDPEKSCMLMFTGQSKKYESADFLLKDGDCFSLGETSIKVLHTPGHTKGSVCYRMDNALITGDTLFSGSIGRCDLYGGNLSQLNESLALIKNLPGSYKLYPGHANTTTLEKERVTNPYLNI